MKIAKIVEKELPITINAEEAALLQQEAFALNKRVAEIVDQLQAGQVKRTFKLVEEYDLEAGFVTVLYNGKEVEVRPMTEEETNEASQELQRRSQEIPKPAKPNLQVAPTPDPEPLPDNLDYHLTENLDPEFDPDDYSLA